MVCRHTVCVLQITSVGMMGLDMAWAPFTPFAHIPMLITVGAVSDRVVARDGVPVVRPMMTITATIDHRFIDGADVRDGVVVVARAETGQEALTLMLTCVLVLLLVGSGR